MPFEVYLEVGSKRTFAGAIDWPGWCRAGRSEDDALEALVTYGPRYATAIRGTRIAFTPPKQLRTLEVVGRLKGDATTDFGAPSIAPAADARAIDRRWLTRQVKLLRASWQALDHAVDRVRVPLAKGPRGGGREVEAIVDHVVGAEASYLRMIGGRVDVDDDAGADARERERAAILDGLERAVTDGIPERGPKGGARWSAPYFVRRAAWHVLDHAGRSRTVRRPRDHGPRPRSTHGVRVCWTGRARASFPCLAPMALIGRTGDEPCRRRSGNDSART